MSIIVYYKYHLKRKKMTTIKNQFITFQWFPLSVFLPVFPVEVWWWLEEHTHILPGSLPSSWCGCTHRYTSPSSSLSPHSADPGRLDLPYWRTGRRSLLLQRGNITSDTSNRESTSFHCISLIIPTLPKITNLLPEESYSKLTLIELILRFIINCFLTINLSDQTYVDNLNIHKTLYD